MPRIVADKLTRHSAIVFTYKTLREMTHPK
jgi:hypothetical protein